MKTPFRKYSNKINDHRHILIFLQKEIIMNDNKAISYLLFYKIFYLSEEDFLSLNYIEISNVRTRI